jgi:hypothetical protein
MLNLWRSSVQHHVTSVFHEHNHRLQYISNTVSSHPLGFVCWGQVFSHPLGFCAGAQHPRILMVLCAGVQYTRILLVSRWSLVSVHPLGFRVRA